MFGFSSTIGNLPVLRQIASHHGIRLELFHCEPNYVSQSAMNLEIFEACYGGSALQVQSGRALAYGIRIKRERDRQRSVQFLR
jgi:hypothetical protein